MEHVLQRDNYSALVSRILVDNIPCLHFPEECASRHIKHAYTPKMMGEKKTMYTSVVLSYKGTYYIHTT